MMHPAQSTMHTRRTRTGSADPRPGIALFVHTIQMQVRSVIIWGIALGALGMVITSLFPSVVEEGDIEQLIESYPAAVRDLAGFQDVVDLSTVEGWLSTEMYSLVAPLSLAFFPILAGAAAIAGAEERGTLDVLLSNPLPRWQLVAARFAGTAISFLGILLILGILTWLPAPMMDIDLSLGRSLEGALNVWPLGLFFGGLAMLCSAVVRQRALAVAIPGGILIVMHLVDSLKNMSGLLDALRPFSAFAYHNSAIQEGINWLQVTILAVVAMILVAIAAWAFERRDIYT